MGTNPEDDLTEPEKIAAAIATHLANALQEMETLIEEFAPNGGPS
ncbi:hypothetical protein [Parathermosynechococcus lividus]